MCYENNEIMFDTDLESWDVILFNKKIWSALSCWLLLNHVDSKTKWNIEKVQFLTIPREFQNENMDWSQQVVLTKYFLSKTMMSQLFKFVSKTNKKLWAFSSKYCWYFKIILPHISKLTRTYSPLKNFQILIQKSMKSVYVEKSAF